MRININLASRKYEDVRQFFVRWGISLAVLGGLTVILATLAVVNHSQSVKSQQQIKDLEQRTDALKRRRDELIAYEKRPENLDVTQQKKFWNTQIAKRKLSWTQLFNDLQRIMPNRAYLNSVEPELTRDNRLKLKLVISGEKREDSRELLKRMEDSTRFHNSLPKSEAPVKDSRPGAPMIYRFDIETEYSPPGATSQPQLHQQQGQATPVTEASAPKEAN